MNLSKVVSHFFEEVSRRDSDRTTLVRNDGIVVYASLDIKKEAASIGALVGGVWQAAEALNSQVGSSTDLQDYRFSFDKSDSGIYILPINVGSKMYYLSTLYKDTFNPALLKRNFRVLKEELEAYLDEHFVETKKVKNTKNKNDFLFNNITDEEMDNLFAF